MQVLHASVLASTISTQLLQITMPATRNRGANRGKAARVNLNAHGSPLQTRLMEHNEDDIARADAERDRLEAEAEDLRDRERVRLAEAEQRRVRLEELAAEEAELEVEAARQRETEAANRQEIIEQEAELAAGEVRVLALRIAIQARRGGAALGVAPAPAVRRSFGNANIIQDGTSLTLPFQPYRTQAMNPSFSDLAVRYPAINKSLFKAISENTLASINVLKLFTDYTPDREKIKVLKVNNSLAVDTLEEDALLSGVKRSSYLIRCFPLYCNILLHFTLGTICYDLTIRLYAYINRLLGFTILYTWESVKSYHFIFQQVQISKAIADGMGWSQANIHLELLHLVRKNYIAKTNMAGSKQSNNPSSNQ